MDEQQKPEIAINFLFNLIYLIVSLNTFHGVFYVWELLLFQILFKLFALDFIYLYLTNIIFVLFIFIVLFCLCVYITSFLFCLFLLFYLVYVYTYICLHICTYLYIYVHIYIDINIFFVPHSFDYMYSFCLD